MSDPETPKPLPDWERIEADYRAGALSTREIAQAHGISHTAINKRAKAKGWTRDLSAKIKAKADALVSKSEVSGGVSSGNQVSEAQIVDGVAQAVASIRLAHRGDIRRSRALVIALLAELEAETGDTEALSKLGEILRNPDDNGVDRLNDLYRKIIALPSRVDTAKKLSEALKNLIGLEREAHGLETAPDAVQRIEEIRRVIVRP